MSLRETVLCLTILFLWSASAFARGGTMEIVPQQGLLLVNDFQQWLGTDYQYTGHSTNSSGQDSSASKLEERYHLQTNFSLVGPHLLNVNLAGDVGLEQIHNNSDQTGSSTGRNNTYQYSLDAIALDNSWHPISVFSNRDIETVVSPFSPTLDTTSTRNGLDVLFNQPTYTTRFRYENNTLDLSGLGVSSSTVSDMFTASGTHNYLDRNFAAVSFSLSGSATSSSGVSSRSHGNTFSLNDTLYLGSNRRFSLNSQLQEQKLTTAGVPQDSLTLDEILQGHLGKALDGDLEYRYSSNSTTDLNGRNQSYDTSALVAQLRHRLFLNLDTRLVGSVSDSSLPGGSERDYSGQLGMNYHKAFTPATQLKLDSSYQYQWTDRTGTTSQLTVHNEPHTVTLPNTPIPLGIAGPLLPGSVTVMGYFVTPLTAQTPPDRVYLEGSDYTVDYSSGRIIWGSVLPPVSNILVTYTSLLDPTVTFSTQNFELGGSLSLLEGHLVLNASYTDQSRQLIAGSSQNGLFSTKVGLVRAQYYLEKQSFSLGYTDYLAGPSKYSYLEGNWQYNDQFLWATFQAQANDRYTMYDATPSVAAYATNNFNASATWSRSLFDTAQLLVSLNLIDDRGERTVTSDSIFARTTLVARFNKLTFSLSGSSSWRLAGAARTRDDYLRLEVKRFF